MLHRWLRVLAERTWKIAGGVSIRTKILGMVFSLMLILGLGITRQARDQLGRAFQHHLRDQSVSVARDVAARATDLVLIEDVFALHELLHDTERNSHHVRYAFILDQNGAVVSHTFDGGFPKGLVDANFCRDFDRHVTTVIATEDGRVWDTAVPILGGRAGVARVGLSEAGPRRTLAAVTSQLLLTTALVALVAVAVGGFLTWIMTRPIVALVAAAKAVGEGDFSRRVKSWASDEIGDLALAFNSMTARLSRADQARAERDSLRRQLLEKVISAQEEERKRIARELHDETSQALTCLMVGLRTLREMCPGSETEARADELRDVTAKTLDDVHAMARELRPSALDDLGLVPALRHYVVDYQERYGMVVDFATRGLEDRRLPPPVETALYRIVQEGLTNVARHAHPSTISVLLEARDGHVRSIIEDDGRGFEPQDALKSSGHLGLHGMRERVELLGGTLAVESRKGVGTSICVDVPVGMDGGADNGSPPTGSKDREGKTG